MREQIKYVGQKSRRAYGSQLQEGGLHSRPCTDSQRTNTDTDITDIFLVLKNIYFNTQGQVLPREP